MEIKKVKCLDCYKEMNEYNDLECCDKGDKNANWDDSRKGWVCTECESVRE